MDCFYAGRIITVQSYPLMAPQTPAGAIRMGGGAQVEDNPIHGRPQ